MPDPTTTVYGWTEPTVGADSGTWGGLLNTNLINQDSYLGMLRVAAKSVTWNNGGTTTLDLSTGTVFFFTVATGGSTIAFSNVPANITAVQLSSPIVLVITNGGSQTITWPGSITWLSGVAPTLQSSGVDIIDLVTKDNGTTWFGAPRYPKHGSTKGTLGYNLFDNGSKSAGFTIDWNANGSAQKVTIAGTSLAITFTAPPVVGTIIALLIYQDGSGSRTVTWPGTVKWPSGVAPTLSTAASAADMFAFLWNGSNYASVVSGQNYSGL